MLWEFIMAEESKGDLENFFVFGYGSLMYPAGLNRRGMNKIYKWNDITLARLRGYKRGMFAGFADICFYGILPSEDPNYAINGTLVKIHTHRDYAFFSISEGIAEPQKHIFGYRMYDLVDVTTNIAPYERLKLPKGSRVYTLVCPEDRGEGVGRKPAGGYQESVWQGIRAWGKDFREEFLETGGVNPFLPVLRRKHVKKRTKSRLRATS
jgi:hypothetical protein